MSDKKPGWQIPDSDSKNEAETKKRADLWSKGPAEKPDEDAAFSFDEFDEMRGRKSRQRAHQAEKPSKPAHNGKKRLIIFFAVLIALYVALKIYNPAVSLFDSPYGVSRILFLIVIGGSFVYFSRASNRAMFKALFSWVAIITVISGLYVVTRGDDYSLVSNITPARVVENNGELRVNRAADGHFWIRTEINGRTLPMMVDTGASMVVLSKRDARRIGISLAQLRFTGSSSTANGTVPYARTRINEFRIGNVVFKDFTVTVNGGDMDTSLLGLDALNQFSSYEMRGDTMILRP